MDSEGRLKPEKIADAPTETLCDFAVPDHRSLTIQRSRRGQRHRQRPLSTNIDANFVAEALSELIAAQQEAFGIVTTALCQQVDPERLKADIATILSASTDQPPFHPVAIRMAHGAMAAADAQTRLNRGAAAQPQQPRIAS